MDGSEKWPVARLIPISSASGIEAQERRLASATLAVMAAVPEFGRALLKPLGAPAGKIETYIEVPFKLGDKSLRPDGVITVTRGGKTWGALVEAKTASNPLDAKQVDQYLDLARQLEFSAVLTISNQYVTSSTDYPVDVDRRKLKRLDLHHWSWIDVLTEAIVQMEHRGVSDPDQAYILGELIRYLSDARSGAVAFDGMGSSWVAVRDGAREMTLRKTDPAVASVTARWDDLIRFLALGLTADLGHQVRQVLPPAERTATGRKHALADALTSRGQLHAELAIPDAAGTLVLVADLRARQVMASTSIDAPRDGTSKGRVSWLLRQIQDAPEGLKVEARIKGTSRTLAAPLRAVRENPAVIYPDKGREISTFLLTLAGNMGQKRDAGRGSFVESVSTAAEDFYAGILQNLRAWKAAPPKLKKAAATDTDGVEDAIERIVNTESPTADEADPEPTPSAAEEESAESWAAPLGGGQNGAQGFPPPWQT